MTTETKTLLKNTHTLLNDIVLWDCIIESLDLIEERAAKTVKKILSIRYNKESKHCVVLKRSLWAIEDLLNWNATEESYERITVEAKRSMEEIKSVLEIA